MLSEMSLCQIAEKVDALVYRMDALRAEIHRALNAANGNQQDPTVQKVADEFDAVLNVYVRYILHRKRYEGTTLVEVHSS